MRARGAVAAVVVVVAAAIVAGCGAESNEVSTDESPARQALDTVVAFWDEVESGDGEAACGRLTERGRALAVRMVHRNGEKVDDCEGALTTLGEVIAAGPGEPQQGADGSWTLDDVIVDGEDAQVQCEFRGAMLLRRGGDGWRIRIPSCFD